MSDLITLNLTVNGKKRRAKVAPLKRLLDVLREDLELPGTKEGCGEGECGACSVLIEGKSVCSCLVPAAQAQGAKIVTVEGLARGGKLSVLQQSFIEFGGAQCGICTPGMLVTSAEFLARVKGRVPGEDEVREALAGNLCRCTGYQKIIDAVRHAAKVQKSAMTKRAATKPSATKRAATKPSATKKATTKRATKKRAAR